MNMISVAEFVSRSARDRGWRALVVGGWVRDFVVGLEPKDLDIEVSCFNPSTPCNIALVREWLDGIAENVKEVGVAFGVFDMSIDGIEVQVSLPRKDSKIGIGHTAGFDVEVLPYMDLADAAQRRDFTFNSMFYDPLSRGILDHHKGYEDALDWTIRVTDPEHFGEDPLRFLRGARFSTKRRKFNVPGGTASECFRASFEYGSLPKDRLWGEWYKIARGAFPGNAVRFLDMTNTIWVYPELERTRYLLQSPTWHPEGTVLSHTINTMDKAAMICNRDEVYGESRAVIVLSAMLHDIGKQSVGLDPKTDVNHRHELLSAELASKFMDAIGVPNDIRVRVYKLIELHMRGVGADSMKAPAVRRLARDLCPATISEWLKLNEADKSSKFMGEHIGMSREARAVDRLSRNMLKIGRAHV